MSKKVLVLQHAGSEKLGTLGEELDLAKLEFETILSYQNPNFPDEKDLDNYSAVISLGGERSVNDIPSEKYPWLGKELVLMKGALRRKMPILGICLGSQMLAKAAGTRVYKGHKKEIGWGEIRFDDWFSKRNPLTFQLDLQSPHMVFHWHGDAFDLPVEGYRLAWNETYPVQMFSVQGNAIGIQFHPEMTEEMIRDWVTHNEDELLKERLDGEKIVSESKMYLPGLRKICHRFFYGFASLIREDVRRPVKTA